MCIAALESTTNSLSSGLMVDGASRHLFSKGEKNVALFFSFNFRTLLASLHAASRAHRSCHSGCAFCGIQVFLGDTKHHRAFSVTRKSFSGIQKAFWRIPKKFLTFSEVKWVSSIAKLLMTFSSKTARVGVQRLAAQKQQQRDPKAGGPNPEKVWAQKGGGSGGWLWASSRGISVVFSRLLWIPVNFIPIGYSLFPKSKEG